jgi:hypothetical protein
MNIQKKIKNFNYNLNKKIKGIILFFKKSTHIIYFFRWEFHKRYLIAILLALIVLLIAVPLSTKSVIANTIAGPFSGIFTVNIFSFAIDENFSMRKFGIEVLSVFFVFYVLPILIFIYLKKDIRKLISNFEFKFIKLIFIFILLNLFFTFIYFANRESFTGLARRAPPKKTDHLITLLKEVETKEYIRSKMQRQLTLNDQNQISNEIDQLNKEILSVYNEDLKLNSCIGCAILSKSKSIKKINYQYFVTDEENAFIEIFKYSFMTSIGQPPSEIRPSDAKGILLNFSHLLFTFFILLNTVNSYIQNEKVKD